MSVTVVIAHIEVEGDKSREAMLTQAIDSVYTQSVLEFVRKPIVVTDTERRGAAWAASQGVAQVKTEWVTLLGDDDWLMPRHHETLMYWANVTGADVVYGKPVIINEHDPANTFEQPCWDITYDEVEMRDHSIIPGGGSLIRTSMLQAVGQWGEGDSKGEPGREKHEDWAMYLALQDMGAKFYHIPDILYCWRHWAGNTSGRGDR